MQNHHKQDHNHSSMLWLMLIGCVLPTVLLLIFNIRLPIWSIIVLMLACVGMHFFHFPKKASKDKHSKLDS